MRNVIRILLCTALMAAAVAMAYMTVSGFARKEPLTFSRASVSPAFQSLYVLGESEGRVAVFSGSGAREPLSVTDIRTASLREQDRAMLRAGIPVDSPEELARLLEDLGA